MLPFAVIILFWTYFAHDPLRCLVAVTNANQETSLASYCACGSLEWIRDPLQKFTYFNYDLAGRLTNTLHPDGYSVTNTFNALDQLTQSKDGIGTTAVAYNLQGLLTRATDASGLAWSNSYDARDRASALTDARGVVTRWTYDGLNRRLTQGMDGGATNTLVWAADGLIRSTDALGNVTGFENDVAGRLTFATNANTELTQLSYDNAGGLTNLFDGNTNRTRFQYDRFGRLTNKVNAAGVSVLRLTYDANGRLLTRTTPEKGTTTYIRDLVGRVRTNLYPHDYRVVFDYDAHGRLTSMSDSNGATTFTYTPSGQLASEDGPWSNDLVTNRYTARLRQSQTLGSWQTSYGYDGAGRLTSVTSGAGAFSYIYFGAGDLIRKVSLPGGAFITNTFDGAGRMLSTKLLNSSLSTLNSHSYTYDAADRRTSITRADGSYVTNAYDKIDQLKSALGKESGGTARLNEQFSYGYDKAGNLTYRTNNALITAFTPDARNQLSSATRSGTLTFAGASAQTASAVTVNGTNAALYGDKTFATSSGMPLTSGTNTFTTVVTYGGNSFTNVSTPYLPGTVTFQYDADGNLVSDSVRGFTYDDEDRLTSITITNFWKSEFLYDGLGRKRITRESAWNGTNWTTQSETRYVYDGLVVLQERDANNTPLVTYTRGVDLSGTMQGAGGIGGLRARTDSQGSVFYHTDGNGNVTALVDAQQTLEARYLYDSYGNLLGKWGPLADANRYRFSSKEWHSESGLYDYGRRFYQPNLQRWMNADPIGEQGGINLHGFVGNSPINVHDPYGLTWALFSGEAWRQLFKDVFIGDTGSSGFDPNSNLAQRNLSGVGITQITDENGDIISPGDAFLRIGEQVPGGLISAAMWLGGEGEVKAGINAGKKLTECKDVLKLGKNAERILPAVKKAVNSELVHAAGRAAEHNVFSSKEVAADALRELSKAITKDGFPANAIPDTAYVDRVLVPIGNNGMAVYQVVKNGTAKLKTVLIAH